MATAAAFSPDCWLLATASLGDGIRLWDAVDGTSRAHLGAGTMVNDLAFAANGHHLLAGSAEKLDLWDIAASKLVWSTTLLDNGQPVPVESVAFAPGGKELAISGGLVVSTRDPATGAELRRFTGHQGQVFTVTYRDTESIASGSLDDTIRIWSTQTGDTLRTLRFHGDHTDEAV